MNKRNSSLALPGLSIACLLLVAAVSLAAQRGQKTTADQVQEEQATILAECKLTPAQAETLKEKFKPKLAALEAWDKANAEKLKAAQEAGKTARQGSDDAAKKKAAADLRTLNNERAATTAEADKAIMAVLTAEQKITLEGVKLAQQTLPRYKKVSPTEEQLTKIKSACALAAKDLAGFTGDDKKDKQGRTTIQKALKWAIDNVILTPDQREIVNPRPAAPPAAAPK